MTGAQSDAPALRANTLHEQPQADEETAAEFTQNLPGAVTCPDCGGALRRRELGSLTQFACRIGHIDTAEVMMAAQFIPPDATLTITVGRLRIVKPAPPRTLRRPIDSFFQSLAIDQGENAVCIILSGTGSDGTLGVIAIKEHGGFTLAQAEFDHHAMAGMPQSAAASGQVDDVLAVEDMPNRLIAYQKHLTGVAANKADDGLRTDAASHLSAIIDALRSRSGHDFSEYKEKTLVRRLQRRMQVLQVETPDAYIEQYLKRPEELDLLFRELLIGVTQFFRDPAAFDALDTAVLKGLVSGKGADETVRVWVPGCATGQEAYTIAILLREAMDERRSKPGIQFLEPISTNGRSPSPGWAAIANRLPECRPNALNAGSRKRAMIAAFCPKFARCAFSRRTASSRIHRSRSSI